MTDYALVAILILRGISLPDAARGLKFFLYPDFSKLNAEAFLVALGHAFFTLSLGMGITMVYGSYLKKDTDIVRSSLQLIGLDTLIAMMAGVAIFPVVFAMGFEPAAGPGLTYHSRLGVWGIDKAMAEIREGAGSELDESAIVLLAGLHRDERYRRGGIFHLSPAIHFGIFARLVTPILVLVTFLNAIGVIKLV